MRCPETIRLESLNPKVQGSIPCASTNMLCDAHAFDLYVGVGIAQRVMFATFDSFV